MYPFCFVPFFGPFFMKLTIIFSALSLCWFGGHVLLFSGSTAMMLMFQASYSQISCDFFSFTSPTDPKPGNLFDAKRTKRGWPKPYRFFLGFLATLLLRISVHLSFVLFCSFFCRWNKLKLFKDPLYSLGDSRARIKKMKSSMIYWRQGQLGGVRARYCAAVHSCAVKCSRETKGKTSVERLFNSRHQASFKMGLIASPCSWSWFKVLTSISWCPACCRDMFQKGLSTATESAVTLSTVREMMYFTKTKRSYLRFAPHPTPESPRQDRFKVLPITGPKWLDLFLWLPGG